MATADDVLRVAGSHVGYVEGPRDNETVFGARTGYNFQPWCGSFVDTVLQDVGMIVTARGGQLAEPSSVYTPNGAAAYRRLGRWVDRNGPAQPGDIVYFDWQGGTGSGGVDHVGIVTGVRRDGQVETIEGNTSPSNAGSQSNGGGVYRRVRPRSVIAGFGRPAYSNTPSQPPLPPMNPDEVKAFRKYVAAVLGRDVAALPELRQGMTGGNVQTLQKALNLAAGRSLAQDGDFGPATAAAVKDVQRIFGLGVDGVVGPRTRSALLTALKKIEVSG